MVFVVSEGRILATARPRILRQDVAPLLDQEAGPPCGWEILVPRAFLPPGHYDVEAFALSGDGKRLYKLREQTRTWFTVRDAAHGRAVAPKPAFFTNDYDWPYAW